MKITFNTGRLYTEFDGMVVRFNDTSRMIKGDFFATLEDVQLFGLQKLTMWHYDNCQYRTI
jgi:hypothetical protein